MLPRKIQNWQGVTLGLLVLCLSSDFVTAGSLRSKIFKNHKTTEIQAIDCQSCDSVRSCAFRQHELERCKRGSCMTIYNSRGLVKQRGCSYDEDNDELNNYCAKNAEKCITCDKEACDSDNITASAVNLKPMAANALDAVHKCYKCDNTDDCEEGGDVIECNSEDDNDVRCYMRFGENISVVRMGCMSDFNDEKEIIELVKQKLLYICEGEKCNGFEYIPQPNTCAMCSSENGENCALDPSKILATINCNVLPYTQCYEHVDNETNGITKRGCANSLDGDSFWDCLTAKPGDKCRLCNGEGCNNQIVPTNRPKCQRCDSSENEKCEDAPDSLGICPIYNKDEKCIAFFEGGVTKRGCSAELKCDVANRACQICSGDGCNTANVRRNAEDIYGIFQDLPLNCNTCEGDECESGLRNPRKCEGDRNQDCLSIFNADGKVIRRGCELEVLSDHKEHCDANPELCFNCKSNGCNTMTDATKYQECLFCDAAIDADCLFHPEKVTRKRKCVEGCVSSLYPRKSNPLIHDFARACFEDIEEDDRANCKAENNCVKCEKKDCNTDILPETGRLTCLHCDGPNCNQPVTKSCTGYSIEDQCYIFFSDQDFSALKMGCKSELPKDEVEDHIKQYFLCDGNDCNKYENLPEANLCYVCDSSVNENCAVDPTKITALARCQNYPYTECSSWVNENNHTVRGCHYDAPIDIFKKCSTGDPSTNCRLCTESRCNGGIFPSRRQQCHRCNSNDDPDCDADPKVTQACPLYEADDACVTKFEKGVTQRGCRSELSCVGVNRKNCQTCSGSNCNTVVLSELSIGDPGLFQGLPLNCYHCDGATECQSNGIVKKCEGNNLQTCTTAFGADGKVVERGCSDLLDTTCDGSSGINCYDCKSNGCNTAVKESDYIDCLYCDARDGDKCTFEVDTVTRKRKCHKGCMTALYARTNDEAPVFELIRTCSDDKDEDDREACLAGKDAKCKACNDASCNKDDLGERKSCYHCKGDDCQAPKKGTCRAVMDHDQCYVEYDETGAPVQLGCKSDYDPMDVMTLLYNKRIWLCDDNDCNDIENVPAAQRCVICSSRTDQNCAIKPDELTADTNCNRQPYTQCYMKTTQEGYTERGCLSSLEGAEFAECLWNKNSSACMSCSGNNCNTEIFPAERLSCHICATDSSANCEAAPADSQICAKYNQNEKCITKVDESGLTVRGCSSQLQCDASDTANCQICDSNDCNTSNLKRKSDAKPGMWQDLPLSCWVCSGVGGCADTPKPTKCEDDEYCMTVFDKDGRVEERGCSNAVESKFSTYCDGNSINCYNCNSNDCNAASSLNDYADCVYCDSELNPNCVFDPAAVKNRRKCYGGCMTALYPKVNSTTVYALTRTCLNDKDAADREACRKGDHQLCTACEGQANCNTDLLPKNRWSCYTCQNEDCEENMNAQTCKYYKEHDQCYMLFNAESSVVSAGCASDLEEKFLGDNIDKLFLCADKENCNSWENIPKPQRCVECDSMDDTDCASEPENIPAITFCRSLPNTQCATLTSSGATKRGCVSNLSKAQMLDCLSGNSANCATCAGDGCNTAIFPADRRRCHRCNTKEDPLCESAPAASAVCPFYSPDEFCSTKIVNDHTYRGCSSDFTCDQSDANYCRMCKDADNCNTIDLMSINIGNPGKWQGLPLNCYHCEGEECATSNGVVGKCEGDKLQTCGTVFDLNGKVVQRACSAHVFSETSAYSQHCLDHPELCKLCKSNGCNVAKSLDDYIDCIFCDGSEKAECVLNAVGVTRRRACYKKCMTGLYPRKDEPNPAFELSRSCLDDLDEDEREACEDGKMKNCRACEGEACNKAALPETPRLTCHHCHGDDCKNPKSHECLAYREHDQCYAIFDTKNTNEVIRLGCSSDLDNADLLAERRRLFQCEGNDCNQQSNFPKPTGCEVCDSSENPLCAIKPESGIVSTGCEDLPWTDCYTAVDKAGITRRGCLSDVSDEVFDECLKGDEDKCVICNESNCNKKIFPENRRSCNRCDSSIDATCENSPQQFNSICPVYNSTDSCVTKVEGTRTLRGCASEFTCDPSDRKTCRVCDKDDCNTINLIAAYVGDPGKWQDLPLNCYHCEGQDCVNGNILVNKCENNNLQTCMTVFGEDGKLTKLGCSDAVEETHFEYCEEHSDKCFACKSNGCNNAKSADEYKDCYFCDSQDGKGCSVNFDASKGKSRKCKGGCVVALYPRSSAEDPAYELSRSCLDDLEEEDREKCSKGEREFCKACEGENCNTMSVPEERHECYQCVGDNCEDPVSQACNTHHPTDQCYIIYDEKNSISRMGCRSDFEMNVITDMIKQKHLLLCDGKNCNKQDIVQAKYCLACDSAEDPRCATNPNLLDNFIKCSNYPYTDCGTTINEDGHTIRGCVSAFSTEKFYDCIMKNDKLCETCTKDSCNAIDIFPENRLRCHQCDSLTNDKCTSIPDSNRVCPIYDPNDTCVSDLRSGTTYRGCSSSLKCYNEDDKRNCRKCKTPGCNTIDLVKVGEDGEPGKWQDVPINCIVCDDEEDCKASRRYAKCEDNPYQNCMTVFNVAGVVIQKGCSDEVEAANAQWCDSSSDNCPRCNSNGCNLATNLDDYIECWACDTDVNGYCVNNLAEVTKTRKCYKNCVTAMYPRDKEENPAYHLARSCLDDLEEDDREACEAGNKEYCKACAGGKCNTDDIPEKRLSCNMCKGENCQLPMVADCPQYRENDQCYILFDEQRSIAAMGCRSEFSNADADLYFKAKRLFLCPDDNCNNVDALPAAQQCKICSSRTDVRCATNPSELDTSVNCNKPPFTECYTLWREDGSTERGCAWNLYDEELLNCLSSNSSVCQTCKNDDCNAEVFPADRAACHICDSSVDPSCEGSPNNLSICPKYDPNETCVTTWTRGVTKRACSSSLSCEGSNRVCSKCDGVGCNTINLAKLNDDNFGKWQDLPLRCYVCRGDDCNDLSKATVATCENNNEQDCGVVFDGDGKVIARDCADKIEEIHGEWCNKNKDYCFDCKSNECNAAMSLTEYEDCVYCDSHKDLSCLWQPLSTAHSTRKCRGGCMTALYASDASSDPAYDLIRTCLDDKELSDQKKCASNNCKSCTGASCNVDNIPEDRKSCFYCASGNCEEPTSMSCPLYKKDDHCFTWFDNTNNIQEMGCLSSIRGQTVESLVRTKRFFVCEGENCNSLDSINSSQKCAVCNSREDSLCATNAKSVSSFKECTMLPYTGCFSKLNDDGSTIRGCQTDLDDNSFVDCVLGKDHLCEPCTGDGCNREIYPADRQQCHICTSEDDPDCESFPTRMQPCSVVNDKESCRTGLSGNETVRGCSSEILCDTGDRFSCRQCYGTECNSIDLRNLVDDDYHGAFQDLPLRCHECIGEHCQSSLGPSVDCKNYLWQDCKTVFHANGTVKRRGCSDAVDDYEDLYCRKHPELCFTCKSNECNIAWELEEYVDCAFCNSNTNLDCVIKPSANTLKHRKCRKECMVTMVNNEDIIRSCLDDKETFNQTDCRDEVENGKVCASCANGNCNTFVYPRDRLKCHICTTADCSNSIDQYCQKYDENDFCFAKFENGQVERMGCGSSVSKADIDEWKAQNKLYTCEGEDCNDLIKLPKGGQCLACNSSSVAACAQDPTAVTTYETCDAPSSECVTKVQDGHTIRGCFSKLDQAEQSTCVGAGNCVVCSGDRCNSEIFPQNRRKCHICSSDQNESCKTTPSALFICPHYVKDDRCVAKYVDGVTQRGCESDLTCNQNDENNCQICETDGCNTAPFGNGALMHSTSLFLTTFLALIALGLLNGH